ncbi:MAG: hypothetical protein MEQ74_12030 [Paracoccus sp.]|nr:hypothetical protein [Paracoccus sp. (in: a-proteobacteria)]
MIRQDEFQQQVMWQMPRAEPRPALATFVVAWSDDVPISVRLVRVRMGTASFGRRDAAIHDQHVEAWERVAMKELQAKAVAS